MFLCIMQYILNLIMTPMTVKITFVYLDTDTLEPVVLMLTWNKLLLQPNSLLTFNKMLNTKLILEGSHAVCVIKVYQNVLCEVTELFPSFFFSELLFFFPQLIATSSKSRIRTEIVLSETYDWCHRQYVHVPTISSTCDVNTDSDFLMVFDGQSP